MEDGDAASRRKTGGSKDSAKRTKSGQDAKDALKSIIEEAVFALQESILLNSSLGWYDQTF
eukprot:5299212-Pyramimonas_sp.AAC.1